MRAPQDDDAQGVATGASAGAIDGSSNAVQTVSARPKVVVQAKAAAHAIDDEDDIDDLEGLSAEEDLGEDDDETAPMKMKQVNKGRDGR